MTIENSADKNYNIENKNTYEEIKKEDKKEIKEESKIYQKEYPKNTIQAIFAKFLTSMGDFMVAMNMGTTKQIASRIKNLDAEIGGLLNGGMSEEEIAQQLLQAHPKLFASLAKLETISLNLQVNTANESKNIHKILEKVIELKLKEKITDIINSEMDKRSQEYRLEELIKSVVGNDIDKIDQAKWKQLCAIIKDIKANTSGTIFHQSNRSKLIDLTSTLVFTHHTDDSTTMKSTTPFMKKLFEDIEK